MDRQTKEALVKRVSKYAATKLQVIENESTGNKTFSMQIAYPDLKRALLRRGWTETNDKDYHFNLKFTLTSSDIVFHALRKQQIVNHNRGDANITCKSGLIETLTESCPYWISWLSSGWQGEKEGKGIQNLKFGVDSFFPRSFVLTGGRDFHMFQVEYTLIQAESYVKTFLEKWRKRDPQATSFVSDLVKEKLVLSMYLIRKKVRDVDGLLEEKKKSYKGVEVSNE